MNSTKLKRKTLQKPKTLPLRSDSKSKKYNNKKVIKEIIQIKRKRIKYVEGCKKSLAFGDNDSIKSSPSQESVIYVGTKYPGLQEPPSVVDLTKSDPDVALLHRGKPRKSGGVKSITTIQSVNDLACASSEDMGLIVKPFSGEAAKVTKSSIQLKRTPPSTSVSPFLDDVSGLISGDLGRIDAIERMVYEMDIDTIVELYKVDTLDPFDGLDV